MKLELIASTFRGIKWSTISTFLNVILQIYLTSILSRILGPTAFGLLAMVNISMKFAGYFSQMGLGPAIIQKKEISQGEIRASFTISLVLGLFAFSIFQIASPLFTIIFNNDQLELLLRVSSFSFILIGLSTTSISLLRKEMRFKELAIVESISYILGYGITGLFLAYIGLGVWSLIIANLVQSFLQALISYMYVKHPLRLTFRKSNYGSLIQFGSKFSIISFLEFIGSNIDTFIIGRIKGEVLLGYYNRAFTIANLPVQNIVNIFSKVIYPVLSKIKDNTIILGKASVSILFLVGVVVGSISLGMIPASEEIIFLLLGPGWDNTVILLKVLLVAVPLNFLSHITAIFFDTLGILKEKLIIQFASVIVVFILVLCLINYGIASVAVAVVISELIKFLCLLAILIKKLKIPNITILKVLGISLLINFIVFGNISLVSYLLEIFNFNNNFIKLILKIATGFITILFVIFILTKIKIDEYLKLDFLLQELPVVKRFLKKRGD